MSRAVAARPGGRVPNVRPRRLASFAERRRFVETGHMLGASWPATETLCCGAGRAGEPRPAPNRRRQRLTRRASALARLERPPARPTARNGHPVDVHHAVEADVDGRRHRRVRGALAVVSTPVRRRGDRRRRSRRRGRRHRFPHGAGRCRRRRTASRCPDRRPDGRSHAAVHEVHAATAGEVVLAVAAEQVVLAAAAADVVVADVAVQERVVAAAPAHDVVAGATCTRPRRGRRGSCRRRHRRTTVSSPSPARTMSSPSPGQIKSLPLEAGDPVVAAERRR